MLGTARQAMRFLGLAGPPVEPELSARGCEPVYEAQGKDPFSYF